MADDRLRCTEEQLRDALTRDPKPIHLRLLALYLDRHQMLVGQIAELDGMIAAAMKPHQEAVARLAAMPGLGPDSALQVMAEVGPQASTFPSAAHLVGWVGTCPGQDESAEENHSTRSAKGSKYLRRILNQAAQAAVKKGSHFQAVFRRLLPRLGYNGAIWAVAHRLCRLVWKILHDGVAYIEQGSEPDPRVKRRRAQNRKGAHRSPYGCFRRPAAERDRPAGLLPAGTTSNESRSRGGTTPRVMRVVDAQLSAEPRREDCRLLP